MPKKSKQSVKQIPAKVGAKTITKSGDKVEVVLNTTKIVKDRTRGKYKPRKKSTKKQDAKTKQDDSLSLLRQQVELEKLRKQQEAVRFEPQQRFRNSRTGGDINQYFDRKSKNDGTKEVVGELSKEVKKLREEIKKKDEKPKEEPQEEPKSKFVQELETTQNEIQRQRIQRGIARRDEEQRKLQNQRRIEVFEKKEKAERLRRERGREAQRNERTALQQSRSATIEQFERKEIDDREKQLQLERDIKKREKQQRELQEAIQKENERRDKQRTEEAKKKSEQLRKQIAGVKQEISDLDKPKQSVASSIVSDFESIHSSDFNQPKSSNPIHRQRTIQQVSKDIVANLDNQPLLKRERQRHDAEQQRPPIERQKPVLKLSSKPKKSIDDVDDLLFESADEFEDVNEVEPKDDSVPKDVAKDILSGGLEKIEKREKQLDDVSTLLSQQVLEEAVDELTAEQRKERRRSFTKEAEEDDEKIRRTKEEVEKLRKLQVDGDKAYQDRLKAQEQIAKDERIARDLLLQEARKKDRQLEDEKIDQVMRELKDKKQKEKKKARDNLRKREQKELIDETLGEIISESVEASERGQARKTKKVSKSLVESALGSSLANEVITATQKIPRKPREQIKVEEKIGNLLHSDYTSESVARKAYSKEDAIRKYDLNKEVSNLKEKIVLLFPKYVRQNMFKSKQALKSSNPTIQSIMDKVREDGELTGMQAVKLKRLLDELASMLQEIVNIEDRYRDRRTGNNRPPRETKDERRLRIRREQDERYLQEDED